MRQKCFLLMFIIFPHALDFLDPDQSSAGLAGLFCRSRSKAADLTWIKDGKINI